MTCRRCDSPLMEDLTGATFCPQCRKTATTRQELLMRRESTRAHVVLSMWGEKTDAKPKRSEQP